MTEKESVQVLEIADRIANIALDVHQFDGDSDFYSCYCQLFDIAAELETLANRKESNEP